MNWTRLLTPPERPWHGKKLKAERKAIAESIAELQKQRAALDDQRAKLEETPLDDLDAGDVFQVDVPRSTRFEVLQTELKLRRRMADFFQAEEPERVKAAGKAAETYEAKKAEIAERLEGIGYRSFVPGQPKAGAWNPGMCNAHPEVLEALENHRAIQSIGNSHRQLNEEAIDQVEAELQRLRREAIAA